MVGNLINSLKILGRFMRRLLSPRARRKLMFCLPGVHLVSSLLKRWVIIGDSSRLR